MFFFSDLNIRRTTFFNQKYELQYLPVYEITNDIEFEIPLSIRIENEAHIFLCDGKEPTVSNCYWFMLDANRGDTIAVRKCSAREVPVKPNEYTCKPEKFKIDVGFSRAVAKQ